MATVTQGRRRRVMVPVPFDPDEAWGSEAWSTPAAGTVNGMGLRAVVEPLDDGWEIVLGLAWRRDRGIAPGDRVEVVLSPEGPQREDLSPDLAAALAVEPAAAAFFDGLTSTVRRTCAGSTARSVGPSFVRSGSRWSWASWRPG